MPTIEEMEKTAKEYGFKFDVCHVGWINGEKVYNIETDENEYIHVTYDDTCSIFLFEVNWLKENSSD